MALNRHKLDFNILLSIRLKHLNNRNYFNFKGK
nr:MAG TPA: hypothetical protein [Bacteriophage sp.]